MLVAIAGKRNGNDRKRRKCVIACNPRSATLVKTGIDLAESKALRDHSTVGNFRRIREDSREVRRRHGGNGLNADEDGRSRLVLRAVERIAQSWLISLNQTI